MENKKTILVYDYNEYIELARRLARDGHKVLYYSPWQKSYPFSNEIMPGKGLEDIEKIDDFWGNLDKADLVVTFDNNTGELVDYLRKKGIKVWGGGSAEKLENDRLFCKELMAKVGLPLNKYETVIGLEKLKEFLKNKKDKFIKVSKIRGDMETYHYCDYLSALPWFDELAGELGIRQNGITFIIEDPINDALETGYDGFVIDGTYPEKILFGYECKDEGYVGKIIDYKNLPEPVKIVNEKLADYLKSTGARTLMSTEIRIDKKGIGYLVDPTIRAPRPPSSIEAELFDNFSDIIIKGAEGKLISPITSKKYGAEIFFTSDWVSHHWLKVDFPKELRRWIKMSNYCKINDNYYVIPQANKDDVALSIVAIGNSIKECIEEIKERVKKITAYKLDTTIKEESLYNYIEQGEEIGIKF